MGHMGACRDTIQNDLWWTHGRRRCYCTLGIAFTEMFQKGERDHTLAVDAKETTEIEWNDFARHNGVLARQAEEV